MLKGESGHPGFPFRFALIPSGKRIFRCGGGPTGLLFKPVYSGSNLITGTALRSREQGAHPTPGLAGSNCAEIGHSQARIYLSLLRNQIDLYGKKQIRLRCERVEVAELRDVFVLDMFFCVM